MKSPLPHFASGVLAIGLVALGSFQLHASDPVWANDGKRNMVFEAQNLPEDLEEENIVWQRDMGTKHQYPKPEIIGDRALVMGDGGGSSDEFWAKAVKKGGDMVCVDLKDGTDIWRLVVPGKGYGPATYGVCGSPVVIDDRAYIVALYDVFCIDMNGLSDGNQGIDNELELMMREGYEQPEDEPIPCHEPYWAADVIWHFDLKPLNIDLQDATSCTPVAVNGQLWVSTAHEMGSEARGYQHWIRDENGEVVRDEDGKPVTEEEYTPAPPAPHLIVLDMETGELIAQDDMDVPIVFHGEWSSPSLVEVNGEKMVIFGDGYGVLHGFAIPEKSPDGEPVILEELWTFDLNPHEFRYDEQGRRHPYTLDGRLAYKYPHGWFEDEEKWIPLLDDTGRWRLGLEGGPSELIGAPTIVGNRAYLGLGRDYNYDHGDVPPERGLSASAVRHRAFGKGRFMCLEWDDIRKPPRVRWEDRDVARLQACASVHDGLVYIVDNAGFLNCWDADTGEVIYKHDLGTTMRERSQIVADGKIYVGDDRSRLQILTAGPDVKLLDMFKLKNHMATIEPTDGHLLVATGSDLILFGNKADIDEE